jgi:ABC-type multidrug transport system ATPase subunit
MTSPSGAPVPASDAQPRCWQLPADRSWVIGREGGSAEIAIADPDLADRHAIVRWSRERVEIRAGDGGRPVVAGQQVLHARVGIGDEFSVGKTTFRVSGPAEISLAGRNAAPLSAPPPPPHPTPQPPATPTSPPAMLVATPANAAAGSAGRWSIPAGQTLHIGQASDQGEIMVSTSELPLESVVVTWNDARGSVQVRAATLDTSPFVDGKPIRHARLKSGQRFSVLDNVFEVSGPAQIDLVEAAVSKAPPITLPPGTQRWTVPTKQTLTIGRDDGPADIKLAGLDLTQHHATVSWTGRSIQLRSTAPQARPFVNGQAVLHARIPVGGRFMIGNHTLVVSAPGEIALLAPQVTAKEPLLRFATVSLKYRGRKEATLKQMSFELARGEVLAIIGPSGAGKSTMCGGLLGEVSVESGTMTLGQVDLAASRMQASHLVSFVPQQPAMFGNLSVRDSLTWVAKLRLAPDTDRKARAERVDKVIAAMELTNDVDKRIDTLSGGQRKRVSTAMELLSDPMLLVLDEPTSGLDEGLDRKMMDSLRNAAAEGCAVIVVTHSMVNIDRADKILALTGKGRLAFFGPPADLLPAFNATNYADVMNKLRADEVSEVRPQLNQTPLGPSAPLAPSTPSRGSLTRHLPRLIGRELARQRRSLRQLGVSIGVGIALTALLSAAASKTGLAESAAGISAMLIALIVCLTFFSMAQSFSAVVDDRDVIEREARWSISASSMILARAITCAPLAVFLGVASIGAYLLIKGDRVPAKHVLPFPAGLLLFAVLLPLAAMALGLLISTLSKSLRRAVFVLMGVLALLVEMTGLSPRFEDAAGKVMSAFAVLAPSRWASAGLGADVAILDAPGGKVPDNAPPGALPPPNPLSQSKGSWVWTHDALHVWIAAGALAAMVVLALVLSVWILRRQLRARR